MWSGLAYRTIALSALLSFMAALLAPERSPWLAEARGQAAAKPGALPKTQPGASTKAQPGAAAKSQPAVADPRSEDRAAIQASVETFAKAFESGDAKALAAHWTPEGEYQNESGVNLRGRDALESSFAEFFAKAPDAKAEVHRESLRFLSSDSAIAEGKVAVRRGAAEPERSAHYSALFVRDGGRWRIAQLREVSLDDPTMEDLGWLVGEWKSASSDGAEIRVSYSWEGNKKFIQARFSVQEKTIGFGGTQFIGVDPATGEIHSWTFEADGGVGNADWQRDGDHWALDVTGTLSDGRVLTETNVLRRISNDLFTWQSVDRMLGDSELPDLPPVKVSRIKP
jgi:uncharacterized protein (TIGR02246 family)